MKHLLLILTLLLSSLAGGSAPVKDRGCPSDDQTLVQTPSREEPTGKKDSGALCLTSARGASFSGEENTFAPAVRTITTARRTQVSSKTSFRLIKAGKVVDRQTFQTFLRHLYSTPSGSFCIERYIYTIRHLLI